MVFGKKQMEIKKNKISLFTVVRKLDESGVSGSGHVITGIIFENGKVVIQWLGDKPSICTYNSWDDFKAIHIDSHPKNESIQTMIDIELDDNGITGAVGYSPLMFGRE